MNAKGNAPKTCIVTGATGAIGSAICKGIAKKGGEYRLIAVCRNAAKAGKLENSLRAKYPEAEIKTELVDLSSKKEVFSFASRLKEPVSVLINNAATTPIQRLETPEGIELQFATNVLGYYWMIEALKDHLSSAKGRVVNVASFWAGDMDIDDLEFKRRPYDNNTAYRQSKQANRMLTVFHAEKLHKSGVTVNACHPGEVNSKLANNLGFGGHESPEKGAETPLWLATTEAGSSNTGKYFEYLKMVKCRFASDKNAIQKLASICSSI
ncbi:MAG: SDR family NAD(P)-dependent oxidoreductase [Candidatus Dadabacteria bacterium]|nr:MAG: SDR family NAD(P)-dependent oxidoreductase [Candidatus Dadabacteria bacterium]